MDGDIIRHLIYQTCLELSHKSCSLVVLVEEEEILLLLPLVLDDMEDTDVVVEVVVLVRSQVTLRVMVEMVGMPFST
jgi:hypothetical protein